MQDAVPTIVANLSLADAALLTSDEVIVRLASRRDGLTSSEAAERAVRFGPNLLKVHRVRPSLILWRQLRNPILLLLLGAAWYRG